MQIGYARSLLLPESPVINLLGKHIAYEVAVGANGRVRIRIGCGNLRSTLLCISDHEALFFAYQPTRRFALHVNLSDSSVCFSPSECILSCIDIRLHVNLSNSSVSFPPSECILSCIDIRLHDIRLPVKSATGASLRNLCKTTVIQVCTCFNPNFCSCTAV